LTDKSGLGISFVMRGVEKTDANIDKLIKLLGSRQDAEALKIAVSANIEAEAKRPPSPIKTGAYRRSIRTYAGKQGNNIMAVMSSDMIYAPTIESGSKAHTIYAKPGGVLAWTNEVGRTTDKAKKRIYLKNGEYTIDKNEGTMFARSVKIPARKGLKIFENATIKKGDAARLQYGRNLNNMIIATVSK